MTFVPIPTASRQFMSIALALLLANACVPSSWSQETERQQPLQGSVIKTLTPGSNPSINEGDEKLVKKGSTIEMTVSTSVSTDIASVGDEFFAKVTKDVVVDGKVVIPKGTLVHAAIQEKSGPKNAGRNAFLTAKFDYLITPDGREIPIVGDFSNKDPKLLAAAKVLGRSAGYSLAGGAVGALTVLKYGGLPAVAATNGYALAGGAAIGGGIGLTASLLTKGKHQIIQPGSDIHVQINEDLLLPSMNLPDAGANDLKLEGLQVKILGMRFEKDPFGEPTQLTLTLDMDNKTPNSFTSFDIALEDEHGSVFYPSPFGDTGIWFQKLPANQRLYGNMSFSVDNPKLQHYLVFYRQYTRQPIAKIELTPAMLTDKKSAAKKLAKLSESSQK